MLLTAEAYIAQGMPVEGYFSSIDAWVLLAVDRMQKQLGVGGDILEVGSYLGRSAVLLGCLLRRDERLHVCDLFEGPAPDEEIEREHERFYVGLTLDQFRKNYLAFHPVLPDILVGPSEERLPALPARSQRIIHIDGSHAYRAVLRDIDQAKRLLTEGGVVAFDDMHFRHTPGVSAAVWNEVVAGDLIPLVSTDKLYATWDRNVDGQELLSNASSFPLRIVDSHDIAGYRVLELNGPVAESEAGWKRIVRLSAPPALVSGAHWFQTRWQQHRSLSPRS